MKTFLSLIVLLFCCSAAHAGDARKNLIGKWMGSNGEGATKMVITLEFKENGDYFRVTTMNGHEFQPILDGKWLLANSVTGIRAVVADADKLIVTYKEVDPRKTTDKTEARIFVIKKQDPIFDGKETLCLQPIGGGIAGADYFVRVP